jgi:hypothetical protein
VCPSFPSPSLYPLFLSPYYPYPSPPSRLPLSVHTSSRLVLPRCAKLVVGSPLPLFLSFVPVRHLLPSPRCAKEAYEQFLFFLPHRSGASSSMKRKTRLRSRLSLFCVCDRTRTVTVASKRHTPTEQHCSRPAFPPFALLIPLVQLIRPHHLYPTPSSTLPHFPAPSSVLASSQSRPAPPRRPPDLAVDVA